VLDRGAAELCLSAEVLAEARDVLSRPRMRGSFPALTDEAAGAFLQKAERKAAVVAPVAQVFTYARDPKDEKYVNLAVAAGARYLVTWDKDLLDLMDENRPEGKDFRQRFPGLLILNPPAFLHELRQQEGVSPPEPDPPQAPPTGTT
jgi:putative PIN family toxin of toxin-antitoxin system